MKLMQKTRKETKRIMSIALTLAMVFACLMAVPVEVKADGEGMTWSSLQGLINSASTDENSPTEITLTNDIVAGEDSAINIGSGKYVTLDLNGHTLNRGLTNPTADGYVILNDGTLVIKDTSSRGNGKITGGNNDCFGGGIYNNSHLRIEGGTISGNTAGYGGGGVFNRDTMTMSGGTISNNTATRDGGGVYNQNNMYMSGGTISGNTATEYGGGGVFNQGYLTMLGGMISNNTANEGGALTWDKNTNGCVNLIGGSIKNNTTSYSESASISVYGSQAGKVQLGKTIKISSNTVAGTVKNILASQITNGVVELITGTSTNALTSGASIGVFWDNVAEQIALNDNITWSVVLNYITCDENGYKYICDSDGNLKRVVKPADPGYIPPVKITPATHDDIKTVKNTIKETSDVKTVDTDNSSYAGKIMIKDDDKNCNELEEKLSITEEEKEKGVNVWVDVKDINVNDVDDVQIKNNIELINKFIIKDAHKVKTIVDICVNKKVGDEKSTKITETNGKLKIQLKLPKDVHLDAEEKYYGVRVHDGKSEYVDVEYDEKENILYVISDKFSTYAICYDDKGLVEDKKGFDNNKTVVCGKLDKLLNKSDSKACKDIISKAKNDINDAYFDINKSLDDNNKSIDKIYDKAKSELDAKRKAEAKKAKEKAIKEVKAKAKKVALAKRKVLLNFSAGIKVAQKDNDINIKWGKVKDASGYIVYANYCGKNYKKVKTIKNNKTTSVNISKLNGKKIDQKKVARLYVVAYKMSKGKQTTLYKSIVTTYVGNKNEKYTNVSSIKINKMSYSLKKGKTSTIKASVVLSNKKKKELSSKYAPTLRFASSDTSVVAVSSKGKITAKAKGSATVYIYAKNGCCKKVKVTVK